MVDATFIDNNRVQVVQNDDISFDTNRPSFILLEENKIVLNNFTVVFPDLIQSTAYYYDRPGFTTTCELWSVLLWQEWGPDEVYRNELYYPVSGVQEVPGPTTRNLPQQLLGTVPPQTSFLDVRARIREVGTPPIWLNLEPPASYAPNNEWINLPGGSCPIQKVQQMQRMFTVDKSGNQVFLRRYQSVLNTNTLNAPFGNPQRDLSTEVGWSSPRTVNNQGLSPNELRARSNSQVAVLIDQRDGGLTRPGETNQCQGSFPDLTATFSVDFIITPVVYKPGS